MSQLGEHKSSEVQTDAAKNRRRFIKRTSAGALLATLPAASAWGTGNLIAASIVASGHGSDYAGGTGLALLSPGYWKNHTGRWNSYATTDTFKGVFGGVPLGTLKRDGVALNYTQKSRLSLLECISFVGNGGTAYGGPSNCNCFLVETLLCAANHGRSLDGQLINFPVLRTLDSRGMFNSLQEFASYLYQKALPNPGALGAELSTLLNNNHA